MLPLLDTGETRLKTLEQLERQNKKRDANQVLLHFCFVFDSFLVGLSLVFYFFDHCLFSLVPTVEFGAVGRSFAGAVSFIPHTQPIR